MKYVIEVIDGMEKSAGLKAKLDITNYLQEDGFKVLPYRVPNNKIERLLKGNSYWKKTLSDVQNGDVIVYQYPAYSRILGDFFIHRLKKIKVKKILVIHDVDSLRQYRNSNKDIKREINFFNKFDKIIAHNEKMRKWLYENGIHKEIISLEIFDYMNQAPMITEINKRIAFTGNLGKSQFLKVLNCETNLSLYGVCANKHYNKNIKYKGAFSPEILGCEIKETFGLVWDGDSIDTCAGMTGEYLKFNNPHKVSFYLSMGMPVIIWKEAAMADFVTKFQCGILIENLNDLDRILNNIDEKEIYIMKKNAEKIGIELRSGNKIKTAIKNTGYC